MEKKITFEEIENNMKKYGYYASKELQYDAFLGLLNFESSVQNAGQDIYAVCLEGPPGAGKTEYAKVYTKLVKDIWNGDAVLVDYQCDATTGKTELFEDINITAVIKGDVDKINIPGKLIEAIKQVNAGKKVVLFIDEYDKAKEETDAFMLQFLQSGKINSTQHGDLEIKEELKNNLQVILCKNDARETLSGPLSRRIKIIRLDSMLPEVFHTVAQRKLIEDRPKDMRVDESLINFVSLIYQAVYDSKEEYMRLPACSEMFMAIQDADRLAKRAKAPGSIIYNVIMENMFKDKDDRNTFEAKLKRRNDKLGSVVKEMTADVVEGEEQKSLMEAIKEHIFSNISEEIKSKKDEYDAAIERVKAFIKSKEEEFAKLKEQREKTIKAMQLGEVEYEPALHPEVLSNFPDEDRRVKRGKSVFGASKRDWTKVASMRMNSSDQRAFVITMPLFKDNTNFTTYEDGYMVAEQDGFHIALVREKRGSEVWLSEYIDTFALPAYLIKNIYESFDVYTTTPDKDKKGRLYEFDCILYNKNPIEGLEKVGENLYKFVKVTSGDEAFEDLLKQIDTSSDKESSSILIKEVVKLSETVIEEANGHEKV